MISSLSLLSVLLFIQPRMLLAFLSVRTHCWLLFTLLFGRNPRAFLAELLPSQSVPAYPSAGPHHTSGILCICPFCI